jgi:hypothetical protein
MPEGSPKRIIVFHHPQGTILRQFVPSGSEYDFTLPFILEPLAPFRDRLTVLSGIDNIMPKYNTVSTAHPNANYTFLTGRPFLTQDEQKLTASGPSFEQLIADHIGTDTPYPRLDFAIGGPRTESGILLPSESAYFWYGAEDPVSYFQDPLVAISRIFSDPLADPNMLYAQSSTRSAVLTQVRKSMDQYALRLPTSDRTRFAIHQERVDQLLQRVSRINTGCTPPNLLIPYGYDHTQDDPLSAELMIEIMTQALACNQTRVATLHFANSHDHRFEWLWEQNGGPIIERNRGDNWHAMVHADYQSGMEHVYQWYMKVLAQLVQALSVQVDADGDNLLDHTLILSISEFGSGRHWHTSLPALLIGGPSTGERWINYMDGGVDALEESNGQRPSGTNMNQLLLSILHHFGRSDEHFGYTASDMNKDPLTNLFL